MASGLMIFGLMLVVLGFGFFMTFVRVPPLCQMPCTSPPHSQSHTHDWGACGGDDHIRRMR